MAMLNEVFGIMASVPKHTYVDRADLDERLRLALARDRHIVLVGASKQGKTSLRRKVLPDSKTIEVGCRSSWSVTQVYAAVARALGAAIPKSFESGGKVSGSVSAKASGGADIPFVGHAAVEAGTEVGGEHGSKKTVEYVPGHEDDLAWLAQIIKESAKRIVVEDFHYLSGDEQRRFASDLKTLWDLKVFVVVVGVWSEQNLLTYYNGDLSGRVEELDLVWTDSELQQVLNKGDKALNIAIGPELDDAMVADSQGNVGLLQRLAEGLCTRLRIMETQDETKSLDDREALQRAREQICQDEKQRFNGFIDAVRRGFKGYNASKLKVYEQILKATLLDATDEELRNGFPRDALSKSVTKYAPKVRPSDLGAALNNLNQLQDERGIKPMVLSYNAKSRKVSVVDRMILFYRKYEAIEFPSGEDD